MNYTRYIEKGSRMANPVLIIINPLNQDHLLRIEIEPLENQFKATMFSATRINQNVEMESTFIKEVVERILIYLWAHS